MRRHILPILSIVCGFLALGILAGRAIAEPAPSTDPLTELAALKAAYDSLKANHDPSLTMLLWAGILAGGLKLGLSLFMKLVYKETKSWTRWVALGAAVPIALLSHFALGNGWFASAIYAGAGPGSIALHELLAALAKKPAEVKA